MTLVFVLCVACAGVAQAERTVYTGQWQCDDRGSISPLPGMNVELWKRGSPDFLPVEWVGSRVDQGFTGPDGRFRLTSPPDGDNYFVRMALRDAHHVHRKDFWGINDWSIDTAQTHNDRPTRDLGVLLLSTPGQSHKCAIWAGVHEAHEQFLSEVGWELPTHGVEIDADAPNGESRSPWARRSGGQAAMWWATAAPATTPSRTTSSRM